MRNYGFPRAFFYHPALPPFAADGSLKKLAGGINPPLFFLRCKYYQVFADNKIQLTMRAGKADFYGFCPLLFFYYDIRQVHCSKS
jgi:hypothetical protein